MASERNSILVVDDEANICDLLFRSLEKRGFECFTASSAEAALAELALHKIDLVITDIKMPGLSGIDLLNEILRSYPNTAVILLTAIFDAAAVKSLTIGASYYILKPFSMIELHSAVDNIFEKRLLGRANQEYQLCLEQKVGEKTEQIKANLLGSIRSLAEALDAKDEKTNGHSIRVSMNAEALARHCKIPGEMIEKIKLAAQLHDIGKIGIPDVILQKSGKLTVEERLVIEQHVVLGEKILSPIIKDRDILEAVMHHHERFSGGGYPEGLSGDAIPFGARFLAVADSYDAMTSDRPYRKRLSTEQVHAELISNSGSQFDPEVVDAFLEVEAAEGVSAPAFFVPCRPLNSV